MSALDPLADAQDVLAMALGSGKSSRLFRTLTDRGLTTGAAAFCPRLRDPGLFIVYGALAPDVTHAAAEEAMWATLQTVAEDGLTAGELQRAKNQIVADEAFGRDGPYAIASQLNEAIAAGDWTLYTTYLDRIERVTLDDVRDAARRTFDRDALTVGYYEPIMPE